MKTWCCTLSWTPNGDQQTIKIKIQKKSGEKTNRQNRRTRANCFFRRQRSRPGFFLSTWFAVHSPIYLWELDSYGCCVKKSQPCMSQDMPAQLKKLSMVVNKLNCQSPPHWSKALRISRGGLKVWMHFTNRWIQDIPDLVHVLAATKICPCQKKSPGGHRSQGDICVPLDCWFS